MEAAVRDVSFTVTEANCPCAVKVSVSAPSVRPSAARGTGIVAVPLELTTAVPLKAPPVMSAAETPDKVYGTDVPAATLVVVSVNVAVEPSLTLLLPALMA